MSEDSQTAHRPGLFKLPPKKHSTGRHRSKRSITREQKGKMSVKGLTQQKMNELRKLERRNRLAQIRANKAAKMLEQKRHAGGAPTTITILSLDDNVSPIQIAETLGMADNSVDDFHKNEKKNIFHLNLKRFKTRYTLLCPNTQNIMDTLDSLRVSDLLLMFWPLGVDCLKKNQEKLLNAMLAQGTPQVLHIVRGLPPCGKQRDSMRKTLDKIMSIWSKDAQHAFNLDNSNDALQLLRQISTMKKSRSNLQRTRPYLYAENIEINRPENEEFGSIRVSGYLRGTPLNVNSLVHIPGYGDFQLERIEIGHDPYPFKGNRNGMRDEEAKILKPDPAKQTPLDSEIIPYQMDADQPAIDDDEKFAVPKVKKRVPKGTSEYQASWLIDDEEEEEADSDESDGESGDEMDGSDKQQYEQMEEEDEANENDFDNNEEAMSTSGMETDENDANEHDAALDESQMKRFREERENCQWPDEVEAPRGMNARERFQRYRGLKSFRTSPWDPKENLPPEYARIYKIVNFKRTKKLALAKIEEAFETEDFEEYSFPGAYVTLHVKNVPNHLCDSLRTDAPLVVFGLLMHEHRMSVLNMVLQKHPSCTEPVRNKDKLLFQVGCRRFTANPIFSQHTNGNKFKMERFMPTSGAFCATTFAPIIFPPVNVAVFRQNSADALELVAHGIVLDSNPDRIVLKRAVLSGHPCKVNKRSAVVRYMFFNREDIEWFKPVELYTHNGRHGRIKQALGTHGLMKCGFDQPLNVQDSVLMNLYKRVFPKWTYCATPDMTQSLVESDEKKDNSDKKKSVKFKVNQDEEPMDQ